MAHERRRLASLAVALALLSAPAPARADYVQIALWQAPNPTCAGAPIANGTGTCCCQQVVNPLPPNEVYFVNVTCHSPKDLTIDLFSGYCAGAPVASTRTTLPQGCADFHPFDDDSGATGEVAEQTCMTGTPPAVATGDADDALLAYSAARAPPAAATAAASSAMTNIMTPGRERVMGRG